MVALGVASFGHLGGIHYQNQTHFDQYCQTQEEKKSAVRRALLTTEDERFVREFILQWKLGRVRPAYFSEKFCVDVKERFSEILTDCAISRISRVSCSHNFTIGGNSIFTL